MSHFAESCLAMIAVSLGVIAWTLQSIEAKQRKP